jgi:transcriptional regulator with XRE-family HTH domain
MKPDEKNKYFSNLYDCHTFIELKIIFAEYLQEKRSEKQLTQNQVASLIKSSQSRVAKMEKNDPTVSLDLMVRSLFALGTGTSKHEIARALSTLLRGALFQFGNIPRTFYGYAFPLTVLTRLDNQST